MVNCYLLRRGGACILVDAALSGSGPRLEALLAQYGVAPKDISLLLLTHGHPDHTGAAEYFRGKGVPLALHPGDARKMPTLHGRGIFGAVMAFFAGKSSGLPPKADVALVDGMRLDGYGIPAAVIALPGHTAGSVGVLTDDGELVAGDMYMCFFGPHGAYIAEDFEQYDATARALKQQPITKVYPGHGSPCAFDVLP